MYRLAKIEKYRPMADKTELIITVEKDISNVIVDKHIKVAEIRLDDGRHISSEQRKKAYATIRDIADYLGYMPEEMKELLKYEHIIRTGCEYFSLSDCSMDTAREFINTIIEFSFDWEIPLSDLGINRTDDINRYLYYCIKTRHCCICGKSHADIHHWDAIGMGNDRRTIDDSKKRKIALCREHHTIAHARGRETFSKMYKVYGIVLEEAPAED